MTSHSINSCLSLATLSSVGRWVTKALHSNLLPSCAVKQGFWKDHLKPFCISLSLSNEKKNLTLLRPPAGTGGGDVPCGTHREEGPPVPCSSSIWRWHPPRILLPQCPTGRFVAWAQKHSSDPWKLHCGGPFSFYVVSNLQRWEL